MNGNIDKYNNIKVYLAKENSGFPMVIEATTLQSSEQTLLTTRFSHNSVVERSSLVIPVRKSKLFFSEVDRDIFLY